MGPQVGKDGASDPPGDLRPAHAYTLPERLRSRFAEPWGPVYSTEQLTDTLQPEDLLVAVGDVVSLTLLDLGCTPRIIVVDYKTQRGDDSKEFRRRLGSWGDREFRVHNPAATLTREAWTAVRRAMLLQSDPPTRIVVDGEEDLVALACFLEAPLGTKVLYGVPNQGVCVVEVTVALQSRLTDLVAELPEQ